MHNKYDFKKFIYEYTIKVVDMKYTINMISSKRCKKKKKHIFPFLHYIKLIENNKNNYINDKEGMQYK